MNSAVAVSALVVAALVPRPAAAAVIDMYDGVGSVESPTQYSEINTFFTGFGDTVNQLTSTFTSLAGANFVILSVPAFTLSATQISTIDAYVDGGGRLLLNSDYGTYSPAAITNVNTILTSLGSSIDNLSTTSVSGYHDTTDIVPNAFTAGVSDINYGDTSSLTGGTALAFGNSVTDNGQEFIAYQGIDSGFVFVIADSDTADNINSTTTNNNGILYCNFAGVGCAATQSTTPEPASTVLIGTGLSALYFVRRRKA